MNFSFFALMLISDVAAILGPFIAYAVTQSWEVLGTAFLIGIGVQALVNLILGLIGVFTLNL